MRGDVGVGGSIVVRGVEKWIQELFQISCSQRIYEHTYFEPRLLTMNDVAQNDTRSARNERTTSMRCNSLHALSHSPKQGIVIKANNRSCT